MSEVITRNILVRSRGLPEIIDYVQGTNAVPLVFPFWDWTIPSGAEARIFVKKPSGKEVYNTASISGNTVTVKPTTQMFAEAGMQEGQIQVLSGEDILATFLIVFRVEKNIISENAVESSNEYGILDGLIEDAREAATSANNAAQAANTAAGAASTAAGAANTAAGTAGTAAENADQKASDAAMAASAAQEAAQRAIAAAQACEGLTDNTRVAALENQMQQVIAALGKTLSIE